LALHFLFLQKQTDSFSFIFSPTNKASGDTSLPPSYVGDSTSPPPTYATPSRGGDPMLRLQRVHMDGFVFSKVFATATGPAE
jgi:hypothetical protein